MLKARFGPTSINTLAPESYISSIWAVHSTEDAICGANFSRIEDFASLPLFG